jgi:TRAP-type C4-dicarboxylate transport system permease small subunit
MIYFFVDYLKSKIPEKVKIYLNIISKVIDIVCEIFAIIILMKLWKEDRIFEFILIVCIVLFSMYTNKKNKLK